MNSIRKLLLVVLLSAFVAIAKPEKLSHPEADRLAKKAVESTLCARYADAWLAADSLQLLLPNHPAGALFHALASFSRYDDLSEVADLRRASRKLRIADSLATRLGDPFWIGMTEYERGYEMTIWRSEIKGALTIRSGAKKLARLTDNVDAQAMSAIYDYYFTDAMAWVPFLADKREEAISRMERGIAQSHYFSSLYRSALVWVFWEKGEIHRGLAVVNPIVERYPTNRIFLQARGDLLRRGKQYAAALEAYQKSLRIYRRVAPKSVRHLCAKGNLVLIYHHMGNYGEAQNYAKEFLRELPPLEDRMPETLMSELKNSGYIK